MENILSELKRKSIRRNQSLVFRLDHATLSVKPLYQYYFYGISQEPPEVTLDHCDPLRILDETLQNEDCPTIHPSLMEILWLQEDISRINRVLKKGGDFPNHYFWSPGRFAFHSFSVERIIKTSIKGQISNKKVEISTSEKDETFYRRYYVEGVVVPSRFYSLVQFRKDIQHYQKISEKDSKRYEKTRKGKDYETKCGSEERFRYLNRWLEQMNKGQVGVRVGEARILQLGEKENLEGDYFLNPKTNEFLSIRMIV